MKTILVNYATEAFAKSQARLNASAYRCGIDEVIAYNEEWLRSTPFYEENKRILEQGRGAGYWIWKPYIILDALLGAGPDDIVVYCDSGAEIIGPLNPLFEVCRKQGGIVLFNQVYYKNKAWTKRDCFVLMDCDEPEYWDGDQVQAAFCLFMNNERNVSFVAEWLYYCCDEQIVTDTDNVCGLDNFPEFTDHRHDQSVLSLLAVKHGIELYRNPTQFGDEFKQDVSDLFLNSPYGTLIDHHREREQEGNEA